MLAAASTAIKRPRGRPKKPKFGRVLNDELIKRLCEAKALGAKDKIACEAAGIHPNTLRNWINLATEEQERRAEGVAPNTNNDDYLAFLEMYTKASAKSGVDALRALNDASNKGDVKAAMWLLERAHGYGTVQQMHILGSGADGSIQVRHHVEPLPDSRMAQILPRAKISVERE